ncbi:MAG TPA: zinc ribbon domain-containing protein [Actinomycetota bacterium]|nr:zinc ribbon domain-containing protein [Actinomycetota bacterium]
MPTYEYRCRTCGATFESRRTFADADAAIRCPEDHQDTVRLLSVFAVTATTRAERSSLPATTGCGPDCACVAGP